MSNNFYLKYNKLSEITVDENIDIYYTKYLKYKQKYLDLKNKINTQFGGKKNKSKANNKIIANNKDEWAIEYDNYYIGLGKLDNKEKQIIKKNPHCAEFFCKYSNIINCTECANYLVENKLFKQNPFFKNNEKEIASKQIKINNNNSTQCKNKCVSGYLYDFIPKNYEFDTEVNLNKIVSKLDKFKTWKIFYNDRFIYNYSDIPYVVDYEFTYPKPKTVVHWGQLKLFLTTLFFMVKIIEQSDQKVHIIYAGSARGDNILTLSEMFPNVLWYLIDPNKFAKDLYSHKQVIEIRNELFTDELAEYYRKMFESRDKKEKLLFISDIRLEPSDEMVIKDNDSDARWHDIIKPDYSYLKFRCPYEGDKKYSYFSGDIYIQPFAPIGSTESRILMKTGLTKKIYNIDEYQGKFFYFNRVLRPSFYKQQIIKDNNYFDHCYDCTFFSHLVKNYLTKFDKFYKNVFNSNDVLNVMFVIKNKLNELSVDRIKFINDQIRSNIK